MANSMAGKLLYFLLENESLQKTTEKNSSWLFIKIVVVLTVGENKSAWLISFIAVPATVK